MVDPTDALVGAAATAGVGSLIMNVLRGSAARNLNALDDTLKALKTSVDELAHDIRALRETDIAQAKDIGALQKGLQDLEKRVDGQSGHYREQLEEHRRLIFERLKEAIDDLSKGKKK